MTEVEKPKEPTSAPDVEVSEVQKPKEGSSKEAGPDSAELAEKLKSMESELGRFKQELGDERKKAEELNAYKLWYDQNAARMQQQPEVPQQEELPNYDDKFFEKPTETVNEMLKQTLNKYEMQRTYQDAYQAAPNAFAQAKMMYPERFEGVDENMVQQIMYAPVQQGQMNPNVLKDPNLWAGAAWIAKGQQTGYTIPQDSPGQLPPTQTESPSSSPPSEEEEIPALQGDALTAAFLENARKQGITKEEIEKRIHERRKREGR